ncbi:MAG TPA: hypothetical protein VF330_20005, partial [Lentzea sp.]
MTMGTPNGAPGPPGNRGRTRTTETAQPDSAELVVDDLDWAELGDIVWLASAVQSTHRERTPPATPEPRHVEPPEPEDTEPPPATLEPEREPPARATPPAVAPEPATTPPPRTAVHAELAAVPELLTPSGNGEHVGSAPLIDSLGCFRALRPLKRETRSWRDDAMVLDEHKTADQVAQTGRWWPVTKPQTEKWLDLTLVVDRSPLMTLWQAQVDDFTE